MTPLVHGRRTLRRLPRGGVLGRRFSVWDAMGYHGIAWASNRGPLTVPTLKEWLRAGCTGRGPPLVGPPGHWSWGAKSAARAAGAPLTQFQLPTLGLGPSS